MPDGNGTPKLTITASEMAKDWLYFFVASKPADTPSVAQWLNRAVSDWLKAHPTARVRAALPITELGDTVAVHLWFDESK